MAAKIIKYYETVGLPLTEANMKWINVVKNFDEKKKAPEDKVKADEPDVPKISKALPVINGLRPSRIAYIELLVFVASTWLISFGPKPL